MLKTNLGFPKVREEGGMNWRLGLTHTYCYTGLPWWLR